MFFFFVLSFFPFLCSFRSSEVYRSSLNRLNFVPILKLLGCEPVPGKVRPLWYSVPYLWPFMFHKCFLTLIGTYCRRTPRSPSSTSTRPFHSTLVSTSRRSPGSPQSRIKSSGPFHWSNQRELNRNDEVSGGPTSGSSSRYTVFDRLLLRPSWWPEQRGGPLFQRILSLGT